MIESIKYIDEAGKEIKQHVDDKLQGFTVAQGAELIFSGIPYIVASSRVEGNTYVVVLRSGGGKKKEG